MLQWFTCDVSVVAFDGHVVTLDVTPELDNICLFKTTEVANIYSKKRAIQSITHGERLDNPSVISAYTYK